MTDQDPYLTRVINREQLIKNKKQAKFDLIKKENGKLLLENRKVKSTFKKIAKAIKELEG